MEKTLYIHIGGIKTGTTALQEFLSRNRALLETKGYLYPGKTVNHWGITVELGIPRPEGTSCFDPPPQLTAILEEIMRSQCPYCIISAEDLAGRGGAGALRRLIPGTVVVKIIYYVRRQDELIESWYNQIVKSFFSRCTRKLDEKLIGDYARMFDHDAVIRPWADMFGRENIIIRPYEKRQMNGDIIQDFCSVIGLAMDTTFVLSQERYNQSLSVDHIEFLRLCNRHFKNDYGMQEYLYREFTNSRLNLQENRWHLLAPSIRREILERYEPSNRRIALEYLGRTDGRLFYAPWPEPDEPWEKYNGLTAERLVPIVAEMIHTAEMRQKQEIQKHKLQPLTSCLEILNYFLKKVMLFIPGALKQYFQEKNDRWYNRK